MNHRQRVSRARLPGALPAVVLMFSLLSCGAGAPPDDDHAEEMRIPAIEAVDLDGRPLRIAATTDIIGDVLANIAGEDVELRIIIPAGRSPHSYTPTPRDVASLEDADIIFINGLDLEESLLPVLEDLDHPIIVPVSAGIDVLFLYGDENAADHRDRDAHGHSTADPHFWFSPLNAVVWSRNISAVLQAADPENSEAYAARAGEYIARLGNLDTEIRSLIEVIRPDERKLLMDHGTLGYLARDYGFSQIGFLVESTSDQVEPSARQVAELAELIQHEQVGAIFIGESSGLGITKLADAVVDESGRDVRVVRLLTGSLAPEGRRGDTYIDYMRLNAERLAEGLSREGR